MNIRCAHCKAHHSSVAEVKDCARQGSTTKYVPREAAYRDAVRKVTSEATSADGTRYERSNAIMRSLKDSVQRVQEQAPRYDGRHRS